MWVDYIAIDKRLRETLSERRYRHVLGCVDEAVRLARRWGADEAKARAAALLHDMTKELAPQAQLKMCAEFGIMPNNAEISSPGLLHGASSAVIARRDYGQPEDICLAIKYHTTGRADMSLLEKVLFVADFIEPTRTFDHSEMTELAYSDLDQAVFYGLCWVIKEVVDKKAILHKDTIEGYNFLLGDKGER